MKPSNMLALTVLVGIATLASMSASISFAMPKSSSLTRPAVVTSTFEGLMSR